MNAKHTPGPWSCKPGTRHDAEYFVYDSECNFLTYDDEEHEANARLISAAPDLFAALIDTLAIARIKWGNLDTDASAVMDRAGKAISKALGPQ